MERAYRIDRSAIAGKKIRKETLKSVTCENKARGNNHRVGPIRRISAFPGSGSDGSGKVRSATPMAIATSTTEAKVSPPKMPNIVQYASDEPSGQKKSEFFDEPLCGSPEPQGANFDPKTNSINFSVFSSAAAQLVLVLFTESDLKNGKNTVEVELDALRNKTGDMWHISLPNIDSSLLYGYRVKGPHQEGGEEAAGHRFDDSCVMLDPYAKSIVSRRNFGELGQDLKYGSKGVLGSANTWPQAACGLPEISDDFDWEGDAPLNTPLEDLVIYEMHVRGFTVDPSSQVAAPGTYEGLTEKLDYLQSLGVNCIELLPVHEFNELEYYQVIPGTKNCRFNFWGYSTVSFFSPMSRYSASISAGKGGAALVREFKEMVKQCHKRGIEVILDVVFNHSAEGNHLGPTLSFRGLDNRVYYMLAPGGEYYNYSGCGNTFNCNQPIVRQFILDCLRYWVEEMHVDGFRFDLAAILTRAHSAWQLGELSTDGSTGQLHSSGAVLDGNGFMSDGAGVSTGTPLADPAVVEMISEDPVLRNTKLIAEAWDADGLNMVGAFPHYGGRWAEWNGYFRDVVRNFIKGTDGSWAGDFASVFCGSPNLYQEANEDGTNWWQSNDGRKWCGGRGPMHSVNFVTAHDGFTLTDLVSYNDKHNEANGEDNNDGENHNNSWNCGAEGPTEKMNIERLRVRQRCNLMCALLLSHGVPMLPMGDEYGHTKDGNNNTYCHDSAVNWFNWQNAEQEDGLFVRFVRHLIKFRRSRSELRRQTYVSDGDIQWHGQKPGDPDWSSTSRLVAFTISGKNGEGLYIAFNSAHVPVLVTLPNWEGRRWDLTVDTSAPSPYNFLVPDEYLSESDIQAAKAPKQGWLYEDLYAIMPYSCVVLQSVPLDVDAADGLSTPTSTAQGRHFTMERRVPGRQNCVSNNNVADASTEKTKAFDQALMENERLRRHLGLPPR